MPKLWDCLKDADKAALKKRWPKIKLPEKEKREVNRMSTKLYLPNQCDVLHPIYGEHDCCLCKANARIAELETQFQEAKQEAYKEVGLLIRSKFGSIDEFTDWSNDGLRQFRKAVKKASTEIAEAFCDGKLL